MRAVCAIALAGALLACGSHKPGGMTGPTLNNRLQEAPRHPLESGDILNRSEKTGEAAVKHILIGWKDLDASYSDELDPRAAKRSQDQAVALIEGLLEQLDGGGVFEALMIQHSEDPGSARTAKAYFVDATAKFERRFIELALRLEIGEWGVIRSNYGFHIIKRVK
ncbi:MAG: peptidyl-prolyl cis-trans isomerase [Deltaproteobacteria bacterium]|jgi:hypothetical protein|nr:peptidyl-prolyl cis-trans isomerase [Deltaproteobacteria bacterium]